MEAKESAARKALELIRDGMVLGLGTGTTARFFVRALAEEVKKGLGVVGIPSSRDTEELARSLKVPLATLDEHAEVDLTVDGADEVDPDFNLIKGLGGALVREKILAASSRSMAVIVDSSKLTETLGSLAPIPVEVIPYGTGLCKRRLEGMGAAVSLRTTGKGPFVSDNGNHLLDARFEGIPDPAALERDINAIPGVVDNGLFVGIAQTVIVGTQEGATVRNKGEGPAG